MSFEEEDRALTAGTKFTRSVLSDFRCDLETDCRCSPEMRPTCEFNVKTRPVRSAAAYDFGEKPAAKPEPVAEDATARHEVNSLMAARLLFLLLAIAGAVTIVTWHFGPWIRYIIQ